LLSLVVAVTAALVVSGLPAAACPDARCCSDECRDGGDELHEHQGSEGQDDESPSCPPLCNTCSSSAPAVGTPVLEIVVIHDLETQPAAGVALTCPETPPPDGVFHPPRLSA
jgi:hypothetical protein